MSSLLQQCAACQKHARHLRSPQAYRPRQQRCRQPAAHTESLSGRHAIRASIDCTTVCVSCCPSSTAVDFSKPRTPLRRRAGVGSVRCHSSQAARNMESAHKRSHLNIRGHEASYGGAGARVKSRNAPFQRGAGGWRRRCWQQAAKSSLEVCVFVC